MVNKFEIISETAFSHEGNFDYLLGQIKLAKLGKVDYIKFQVFIDKDAVYSKNHSNYKIVGKWIIGKEKWIQAFIYAKSLKLKIIVLPIALSALDFCMENDELIDAYEVHSVCFNEYYLLKKLSNLNKEIILGIGGRYPEEINYAIETLSVNRKNLILMYGFQSFPTDITKINLNKIKIFSNLFNCKIGYADHTRFNNDFFYNLIEYSYLLFARLFEKHFTLDKTMPGWDHAVSANPEEMKVIVEEGKRIVTALGEYRRVVSEQEKKQRESFRRSVITKRKIKEGELLQKKDLDFKRPGTGIRPDEVKYILGRKVNKNIDEDELIKWEDLI